MRVAVAGLVIIAIAYNHRISFTNAWNAYSREIISTRDTKMAVALWLKHNTPHAALIALHDIGTVGYFSQRRILDLVGLVNPEVIRCYLDSRSKTPVPLPDRNIIDYLRDRKPDYLVMFPDWDRFFNLLQPSSMKHFQLVYTSLPLYPGFRDITKISTGEPSRVGPSPRLLRLSAGYLGALESRLEPSAAPAKSRISVI